MDAIQHTRRYTYADYLGWDDGRRYELIDGTAYLLAAPSSEHQRISGRLFAQLFALLQGKTCEVFSAPFDVRLYARGDDEDTVVQPDISVICDPAKIDHRGCHGAPDFIIEILSPTSGGHDRLLKLNHYRQAGVREYWIVDPQDRAVSVFLLDHGRYYITAYGEEALAPVHVLGNAAIDLRAVFAPAPGSSSFQEEENHETIL